MATTTRDARSATFRNPLKLDGADPWLMYHDGWYYLSATAGSHIALRRARRIADLAAAEDVVMWQDNEPTRDREMWAAEFYQLDGGEGPRWYVYYTASDGKADDNHRMYVLESAGADPMGPYVFKAKLRTDPEDAHYAIDGTVLRLPDGSLYHIWCGRPSPTGQGLYIARMDNPWTIVGPRTYVPADGFGCSVVREGPITLLRDDAIHLIYSACDAASPDYRLGRLTATIGDDLLDASSWRQHPDPIFARVDADGVYGPGHNSFFRSPDSTEDWICYHAKHSTNHTFSDRSARAQPFTWHPDGTPNLGQPLSLDIEIPCPSGE